MNLHKLNHSSINLSVPWVGETFRFAYNPKGYDDPIYRESVRVSKLDDEDPEKLRINTKMLVGMLVKWDLTDGCPEDDLAHRTNSNAEFCTEHAIPITEATVAELPTILRGRMVSKIMEHMASDGDVPKSAGS